MRRPASQEPADGISGANDSAACKPSVVKHLNAHKKFSVPVNYVMNAMDRCVLQLDSIIGYSGKWAATNMQWKAEYGFYAFSIGSLVCVEDIK